MFTKIILVVVMGSVVNAAVYPFFDRMEYERTPLGDSIDRASMKLLKEVYEKAEDKNIIASPLGVMLLLSLYSGGAGDQSRQQISSLLGGEDYKAISGSYSGLSRQLAEHDPSYFTVANKIYVSDQYELADQFTSVARTYESEVETLNFKNPASAASIINRWADEKTKGHIKDPVSPDALDADSAAALFNVIFFQGHWHVPFEKSETEEKDFHVDKNTVVKKPTMKLTQSLFYTENPDLKAKMIELPYKESGFRMVVVLPDEKEGLKDVVAKVKETGLLADIMKLSPAGREINLEIPKFEVKSSLDLNKILPEVGVSKIFSEPAPGIVKGTSVVVSKAFQEAIVKVDEEGATAGAFTGAVAVPISFPSRPPAPMVFKVDHPFLYTIMYQDKVLFAGTYTR